jgi:ABC-2 type transport system permease protein
MLHQISAFFIKEIKILLRDKTRIIGLFVLPLVLIVIMSLALQSLFTDDQGSAARDLPVINLDSGVYSRQILAVLEEMNSINLIYSIDAELLSADKASQLLEQQKYRAVLLFPKDFSQRIAASGITDSAEIILMTDAAVSIQYIAPLEGMLSSVARETVYRIKTGEKNISPVLLKKVEIAGGGNQVEVDTYQQNVPGYAILGVFLIVGTMAASIMQEKQEGTFRRLQAAPVKRAVLLFGKVFPFLLINLVQVAIMFSAAHFMFGMRLGNIPALLALSFALSASATGLGMMLAALAKADTQIGGIASLLTLTMSALGGCFMPVAIMPGFLKSISRFTPHSWAMQGFQQILVRGSGIMDILPQIGVLTGFALLFFLIGSLRFRFE